MSEFIKINIIGKIFEKKSFDIRTDVKIDIVKRLIMARLKFDGFTITPTLNKCYLISLNNERLDNNKLVNELLSEKKIENNCYLSLDISVLSETNDLLSYNFLLDDKLEFGNIDIDKKQSIANNYNCNNSIGNYVNTHDIINPASIVKNFGISILNSIIPVSHANTIQKHNSEGWYDNLSWDDKPINDKDWE